MDFPGERRISMRKSEINSLIREVFYRLQKEPDSLESIKVAVSCPDQPDCDGITRREVIGRLTLLMAGAAAYQIQGCGPCNDLPPAEGEDGGMDAEADGCNDTGCITEPAGSDSDTDMDSDTDSDTDTDTDTDSDSDADAGCAFDTHCDDEPGPTSSSFF